MTEKPEKNVKWVLVVSLIMFFWQTLTNPFTTPAYYFTPGPWYYIRNVSILSFIVPTISATLYIADFWEEEHLYRITIAAFIISMSLLFVNSLSWISDVLGISPF